MVKTVHYNFPKTQRTFTDVVFCMIIWIKTIIHHHKMVLTKNAHQVLIHLKKKGGGGTLINCAVSVYRMGKWYFTGPIFRLERDLKRFSREGVQKLNRTSDSRGVNIPGSF